MIDSPVFTAPWQVQALALQSALRDCGLISAAEWAQALGESIQSAQRRGDPDDGSTYWQHWADALESLLIAKGLVTAGQLHALEHAWAAAADCSAGAAFCFPAPAQGCLSGIGAL